MPNNLIIFDVDVTLTDTVCMGSDVFLNAFVRYLGIELLDDNSYEIGQSRKTWNKEQIIEYFNQKMSSNRKPCVVTMENENFVTVDKSVVSISEGEI